MLIPFDIMADCQTQIFNKMNRRERESKIIDFQVCCIVRHTSDYKKFSFCWIKLHWILFCSEKTGINVRLQNARINIKSFAVISKQEHWAGRA